MIEISSQTSGNRRQKKRTRLQARSGMTRKTRREQFKNFSDFKAD
jgi:hypothetical protein